MVFNTFSMATLKKTFRGLGPGRMGSILYPTAWVNTLSFPMDQELTSKVCLSKEAEHHHLNMYQIEASRLYYFIVTQQEFRIMVKCGNVV